MSILRNHYVLAVHDKDAEADWYCRVFGFEPVPLEDNGWNFVKRDDVMIMLGECPDAVSPNEMADHSYYAYLVVDDVDGYYDRAKAEGAELWHEPEDKSWGMREFAVKTPGGHRIMVAQVIDSGAD